MNIKKILQLLPAIVLFFSLVLLSTSTNQVFAAGLSEFNERGVTQDLLDEANPLKITGATDEDGNDLSVALSTPGGIISRVLVFAFPIAGLILFVMIIWGGFETLTQAAGKKSVEAGRQRITAAIMGFALLFASIWIIRVLETVFGIKVLFF